MDTKINELKETVKRYEVKIEDEVQSRVDSILAKKDELQKELTDQIALNEQLE